MKFPRFICWLVSLVLTAAASAQLSFTYETDAVLLSSGDFGTPDGRRDVVLVDRVTGNMLIGKQNSTGQIDWTAPEPTGITGVTGLAVEKLNGTTSDVAAVTAPTANRITLASLPGGIAQLNFRHLFPTNPGVHGLAPFDANADGTSDLLAVGNRGTSSLPHDYEMITNVPTTATLLWQKNYGVPTHRIYRVVRKTGTTPVVAEFFNTTFYLENIVPGGLSGALPLSGVTIAANSLLTYGNFDGSAYAQVIIYTPGATTAKAAKVTEPAAGSFGWATATTLTFPLAVKQLVTIPTGTATVRLGVLYTNGTGAIFSFDGTTLTLRNTIVNANLEWLCPTENDILISKNSTGWFRYNTSSTNATLAPTQFGAMTDFGGKARVSNVVFFSNEPFVDPSAAPLAQAAVREWSTATSGSALAWNISSAPITAAGIGSATTTAYTPAASASFALPNQYRANISFKNLEPSSGPRTADLTIDPASGNFPVGEELNVRISPTSASQSVFFRINGGSWTSYNASDPPTVQAATTIEAYTSGSAGKSPTRSATYTFAAKSPLILGASTDADNDGMPDAWEKAFNLASPTADADGDGVSNLDEYLAGTDPRDASDFPEGILQLRHSVVTNGGVRTLRLAWDSALGNAILEASETLLPGSWQTVSSGIVTEGSEKVHYASLSSGSPVKRFFRLRNP